MKKTNYIIISVLSIFLCACGAENVEYVSPNSDAQATQIQLLTPTPEPTVTPTPTETETVVAYINSFDKINCTEMKSYVDEAGSIRNSNLLNYGFLTYDSAGNIYYVNENNGNIYKSDSVGENKQQISEEGKVWGWLQLGGEWIYYLGHDTSINRISLVTGETKQLFGAATGAFTVIDEKIYFEDKKNEFVSTDLDGNNRELVFDSKGYINLATGGPELWVAEIYGTSRETLLLRYLIKFDGEKTEVFHQRGYFPLLAGKYLSFVSKKTGERHIYNLETGRDINLAVKTEMATVSDGENFFYVDMQHIGSEWTAFIYQWNGTKSEEIMVMDGVLWVGHMFLTPDKLYIQPHMEEDGKQVTQLWYYDLETGEKGQVY